MKTKKIGQIEFAPITMGCMAVADSGTWGSQDEAETIRTMHRAKELGINCFDTAPGYGNGYSEELLGKAFEGSASVVIASKVSADSLKYDDCIKSCERSLKLLKRDYIDLFQVHWANDEVVFEETASALIKLKEQGKIREYGVCNFGVKQMSEMINLCDIKSNQLMYNLFFRGVEFEVKDILKEKGLGLLTYSSLAQGLLTGKYKKLEDVPESLRRTRHYSCSMNPASPHGEDGCKVEVEKALSELVNFAHDKSAAKLEKMQAEIEEVLRKTNLTNASKNSQKAIKLIESWVPMVETFETKVNMLSKSLQAEQKDKKALTDAFVETRDKADTRLTELIVLRKQVETLQKFYAKVPEAKCLYRWHIGNLKDLAEAVRKHRVIRINGAKPPLRD